MAGTRNGLGISLQNLLSATGANLGGRYSTPGFNPGAEQQTPAMAPVQRSKGQMIAGILSDAVSGFLGREGSFGATLSAEKERERTMQAQEAQWSRRRDAENQDWLKREQWQLANKAPDVSPMQRDLAAWEAMTPDQRIAYQQMQKAKEGDPIVSVSLPNGQFYSGPRSGLTAALTGQAPQPPVQPIGVLRPVGGPTQPASGGFRP